MAFFAAFTTALGALPFAGFAATLAFALPLVGFAAGSSQLFSVGVDAVTGPYEVIVLTEANGVDELGKMVVSRVQLVPGITRTLTCSVVHL